MVSYYAMTNYHILNCILHKLKYNNDKESILYISKWHPEHDQLIKNIKKTQIFSKVLLFEEILFPSGNNKIGQNKIKKDIEYINKEIINKNKIDFSKFEEINICGDHYGLSIYLNSNNIKYNYFEDGCGILSNVSLLIDNIKKIDYSRYQILDYLKLPGNSKCVIKRYGDLNSQLPNYYNKKDVHFSVKEEIEKIDNKTLQKMISIFDDTYKIEDLNNYNILLTFHYNNLNILSLEEQRLFYSYLLDFFGNNKTVIKPHPSDRQGEYDKWFPSLKKLPRKLPSEFLTSLVKGKFNNAITGWSTSINGLKDKVNNIINFDQQIDYKYSILPKYYIISRMIVELLDEDYKIICYDFNTKYIKNFIDTIKKNTKYNYYNYNSIDDIEKEEGKKVIIFDKIDKNLLKYTNSIPKETIIFEIENTDKIILNNDYKVPLFIEKSIINEKEYINYNTLNIDSFSLITKDLSLKNKIVNLRLEKELKLTNVKINLLLDLDKQIYIYNNNQKISIINNLNKNLDNKEKEIILLKNRIDSLEKEHHNQVTNLETQIKIQIDKNNINESEIVNLKSELTYIKNSNSWKMTKWYRDLGKIIKKSSTKNRKSVII